MRTSINVITGVVTQHPSDLPDVSPAELARIAARTAKVADIAQAKADAKSDAFVQSFVAMTPAQVAAYVEANVGNLAEAKQLLKKLALMMLAIAKEQYQ